MMMNFQIKYRIEFDVSFLKIQLMKFTLTDRLSKKYFDLGINCMRLVHELLC